MTGDVRLFSHAGYDRFQTFVQGEAQICWNGLFQSVCDDSWDNQDASVVCRQLGYLAIGNFKI